ncbi:MAG: CcmD family protein [Thermoanaerobaculia bacterium]|jgi:CcmD family protein|nr:CcmD family protein [Thermoanaerobaculia bacterium]
MEPATVTGGLGWIAAVNAVIWTGLFLFVFLMHRKIARLEKDR